MKYALDGKCVSKTGAFRKCSVSCNYRRARPWGRKVGEGGRDGRWTLSGLPVGQVMLVAG